MNKSIYLLDTAWINTATEDVIQGRTRVIHPGNVRRYNELYRCYVIPNIPPIGDLVTTTALTSLEGK